MKPRIVTVVSLISILCNPSLAAQGLSTVKPEEVGLSSQRLKRIGAVMQDHIDAGRLPGGIGMIARRGKLAYFETWGMRDREAGLPMTKDTIFRIYSMTKPITSVAVMMLYEEGRFLLDEPVSKYIPALGNLQVLVERGGDDEVDRPESVDAERNMTIRDLLRHTSGLTNGRAPRYLEAGIRIGDKTVADMVGKLSNIPLKYPPGTQWEYSISSDVLGRLVEVLSGVRFDRFLETRIFDPLRMRDTGFYVPQSNQHRFAQLYSPSWIDAGWSFAQLYSPNQKEGVDLGFAQLYSPGQKERVKLADPADSSGSANGLSFFKPPTYFSGAVGLVSTAEDYFRFCQMLLNGGKLDGVRILSPKTIELMTTDHLGDIPFKPPMQPGYGFGLGFAVSQDLRKMGKLGSEGEYFWYGAAGTLFWVDPEEEMIGIYMQQVRPFNPFYREQFKLLVYQAIVD